MGRILQEPNQLARMGPLAAQWWLNAALRGVWALTHTGVLGVSRDLPGPTEVVRYALRDKDRVNGTKTHQLGAKKRGRYPFSAA